MEFETGARQEQSAPGSLRMQTYMYRSDFAPADSGLQGQRQTETAQRWRVELSFALSRSIERAWRCSVSKKRELGARTAAQPLRSEQSALYVSLHVFLRVE